MFFFNRLRVGSKLLLLTGIPVLGILALSVLVVLDVQERSQAAEGLGSIEDLAQLTEKMLRVIDVLQWERAEVTYAGGQGTPLSANVKSRQAETDTALGQLSEFIEQRDEKKLSPKLRENLRAAHERLELLPALRLQPERESFELLTYLDSFAKVNDALIGATAALTQLSEDKQLVLSIGGLVSAMQVIERNAREHALLNYVFGKQEFPPGTFRYLVTLLTEQEVYTASLRTWASNEEFTHLETALKGPLAEKIARMRQVAIETTEGTFDVDPKIWFDTQSANMLVLTRMEHDMAEAVRGVVSAKMVATRRAVRLAMSLVLGVVAISLLLGWRISRSLTRSVRVLSQAAESVHENNDFGIRAEKTSGDELGLLTDAFNGMLAGIQARDGELDTHRQNLEALVTARTEQLSERNEEMKLVLDSIDQGLAMLDRQGNFLGESSRAFKLAFGSSASGTSFCQALAKDDAQKCFQLESGYEQLIADILPIEVSLDQMPRSIIRDGRHYSLSFIPVMHTGQLAGALLVTRDVTVEVLASRAEFQQRQRFAIFERVMRDRAGFLEFMLEATRLVTSIRRNAYADDAEKLRALHTLKGVAAVFEVNSVSEAAHRLEQAYAEQDPPLIVTARDELLTSWDEFRALSAPIVGEEQSRAIDISREELAQLIARVRGQAPRAALLNDLIRLSYEPVAQRFRRIEDQLKRVARRLDRPEPLVTINAHQVRLAGAKFREFWASLAHVVRNIVDHGLELEAERIRQGKPARNQIELLAWSDASAVCIEIADDGRGIDWGRLELKARQNGLPASTRLELVQAIFADGVSTTEAVTQTSGRGVGMSAVQQTCLALGGFINVQSETGHGTRFQFMFPPVDDQELEESLLVEGTALGSGQLDSLNPHEIPPLASN
jgi:two-component system chemotaxis sensor kinase CheA